MDWAKKAILVTGGTGSFGQEFTAIALKKYNPSRIRIFSRDELKQYQMRQRFKNDPRLTFLIGDIRDQSRISRAMDGIDIVIHAAALKQVPSCEYNPFEAVQTNIIGAENVINAAIDHNVEKVMAIGTDKAVNPINLYGATKMCMEKIFVAANSYVGAKRQTKMSCVRYGNVVGSRGSVIPLFQKQKSSGTLTITDKRMTRFWITLGHGVEFVIKCVDLMHGGEVFVPKIPSMKVTDLAETIAPGCKLQEIGIRPGEKVHEVLLTEEESRHAKEFTDFYLVEPEHPFWDKGHIRGGKLLPEGFKYTSRDNKKWLSKGDIRKLIEDV